MNRESAKKLISDIVAMSKADEVEVNLSRGATTHLRYARNTPSTSGVFDELRISIRSSFGKRSAAAVVNQLDADSLKAGVARSEEMARLAPEDPEHLPGLESATYLPVKAYDDATAEPAVALARGVAGNIAEAEKATLVAAGFAHATAGMWAIGNSRGLFGFHRSTTSYIGQTVRTPDAKGSGWAADASARIGELDFARVSAASRSKATSSAAAKPLAPGKYVTILEPACVANLVGNMVRSMSARSADEGRSFFSKAGGGNRIGEKIFPESVTIRSNPTDEKAPGRPWGAGGVAQKAQTWIEKGAVKALFNSRFWAAKQGTDVIPGPSNLLMSGGAGSVEDLIASTERGVLITSLWYIRNLDPRTLTYTGLTRDGVFLIENGKIAHPVTNFRWNDSPVSVLKNAVAMSAPVRMPPRPSRSVTTVVPAIKTSAFNLASVSEAV